MENIDFKSSFTLNDPPPEGFGFIYKLTGPSGKSYIGKTIHSIHYRFSCHCKNQKRCLLIERYIKKYGKKNFTIEIIGIFLIELLDLSEIAAIKEYRTQFPNGLNLTKGGSGVPMTEDIKEKIKNSAIKRFKDDNQRKMVSERQKSNTQNSERMRKLARDMVGVSIKLETKIKLAPHWKAMAEKNRGVPRKESTKRKISESLKKSERARLSRIKNGLNRRGMTPSEKTRQKMSLSQTGRKHSDETKEKCRLAKIGFKHTEETKKKLSESQIGDKHWAYGTKYSEEHRKNISNGQLGRIQTKETKFKISQALKGKKCNEIRRLQLKKILDSHRSKLIELKKQKSIEKIKSGTASKYLIKKYTHLLETTNKE